MKTGWTVLVERIMRFASARAMLARKSSSGIRTSMPFFVRVCAMVLLASNPCPEAPSRTAVSFSSEIVIVIEFSADNLALVDRHPQLSTVVEISWGNDKESAIRLPAPTLRRQGII